MFDSLLLNFGATTTSLPRSFPALPADAPPPLLSARKSLDNVLPPQTNSWSEGNVGKGGITNTISAGGGVDVKQSPYEALVISPFTCSDLRLSSLRESW